MIKHLLSQVDPPEEMQELINLLGVDDNISKLKLSQRSLEEDLKYIFGDNLLPEEKEDQLIKPQKSDKISNSSVVHVSESEGKREKGQERKSNSSATNGTKCPENSNNQSPMRRSRRSNIGHHWKYEEFGQQRHRNRKDEKDIVTVSQDQEVDNVNDTVPEDESDNESIKSDLTNTLEAFDDEIDESEIISDCQIVKSQKRKKSPSDKKQTSKKKRKKNVDVNEELQSGSNEYAGKFFPQDQLKDICCKHYEVENLSYKCKLCSTEKKEEKLIINHIASTHLNIATSKCQLCGYLSKSNMLMEKHLNGHGLTREIDKSAKFSLINGDQCSIDILPARFKPFQCEFCNKTLNLRSEAKNHRDSCGRGQNNTWYTIINENEFECAKCKEVCKSMMGIKAHLAYTHNETLPFYCDQCGDSFITETKLKFHFSKVHTKSARNRKGKTNENDMIGMYHLKKYFTYLGRENALKILPSYYNKQNEQSYTCKVCEEEFTTMSNINNHLLDNHLKLMLYKCELCSKKLRNESDYQDHIQKEHGASSIQTLELPTGLEPGANLVIVQDQQVEENEDLKETDNKDHITTIIIEKEKNQKDVYSNNHSENVEIQNWNEEAGEKQIKLSNKKTEEIYVEGAEKPILGKTRAKLDKLTNGRLFTMAEADEIVKQNVNRTILDRMYHCLVCQTDWKSSKLDVAREHIYDHFGIYLYQCEKCLDLFRKQAHYHRHLEIHNKRDERDIIADGDKVGNYHLISTPQYLHWKKAKPIIDTYFVKDPDQGKNSCKLCQFTCQNAPHMRTHLLQYHLKLNVFKCSECNEEFAIENEIKKHMSDKHQIEFEGLEKVDDPDYESIETEFDVEPDQIVEIPMDELSGKKISSAQGRVLRKTKITRNEAEGVYECELCDYKKEYLAQLSDHVMTAHFNVYMYRCPLEDCGKLLRNWSRYTTHRTSHKREKGNPGPRQKRQPFRVGTFSIDEEYHLLQEDVYVGKEEGLKIARGYFFYDEKLEKYKCKMCDYIGRHQTVEQHVLAIHLRKIHLFKCDHCGKMIRYSENAFKDHMLLHSVGKLPCEICQTMDQGGEKRFTKASLAAHMRRIHKEGEFPCKTDSCQEVFKTVAELKMHERQLHFVGLPASKLQYMCEICNHTFPRKQQLEWHLDSCQAGRSRSRFRKMISDCLTWMGNGVYVCNFCRETFQPPRPTASSLPLARKHVVTVHKMNHLRKAKMSWTQGVEGLNAKKKAERRERATPSKDEQQIVEGEPEQEVILQYYVPEDIANTEEVEVNTFERDEESEEPVAKIRVINTYFET